MRTKISIILTLLIFFAMPVYSQNTIDKIENNIFGMTYANESEQKRIERLEKSIYGAIQSGNINSRLTKLSKDLSADEIGNEIEPSKYTEFEEEETADGTVDYPLINEFEKKVFNKEYKNKKLDVRLSELEKKVFNKTYPTESLNERTDRLKSAIQVNKQTKDMDEYMDYLTEMPKSYEEYFSTPYSNNYSKPMKFAEKEFEKELSAGDSAKVSKILNTLEKKILKKTYQHDNNEERLERLEENMFNTSFPQDKFETRLERLALAYQATKTSKKYDTNKLSQHMATAMQVGMFLLMILAMVL